jgi:NitT/TauT family transport system substrate-binding protein
MRGLTLPVKLLIVAIALLTFILISCVPAPLKPLRIGTNVWPGYEPLFLARELGYYGNTPIQLVEYPNFDPNRAYRNGEVEMSATPMTAFLPLAPTHPDVRAWLIMDISNGADAIVAKRAIANLQSLKGRRVGFDRSMLAPFVLSRGLEQVGLSLKDVKIVSVELSDQEEAFKQGRVDAIVTFEPYRSNILNAGAKLLFDSTQIPGEVVDVLIGSESLLTTHATQLQVLIQGWFRALDYIRKILKMPLVEWHGDKESHPNNSYHPSRGFSSSPLRKTRNSWEKPILCCSREPNGYPNSWLKIRY